MRSKISFALSKNIFRYDWSTRPRRPASRVALARTLGLTWDGPVVEQSWLSPQACVRTILTIAWYSVVFALAFGVAMAASALGSVDAAHLPTLAKVALLFGTLGALYGTIVALDPRAPRVLAPGRWLLQVEARASRTALCSVLGVAAASVVHSFTLSSFALGWLAAGAMAGALFGWYGWQWAKHIDF